MGTILVETEVSELISCERQEERLFAGETNFREEQQTDEFVLSCFISCHHITRIFKEKNMLHYFNIYRYNSFAEIIVIIISKCGRLVSFLK